jgi:ribosomal protein S12 methylthiotransferase accessory factor
LSSIEAVDAPGLATLGPPGRADLQRDLARLAQPIGGVFRPSIRVRPLTGEPKFFIRLADVGKCGSMPSRPATARVERPRPVISVGTSVGEDDAMFLAHAEGLERYATCAVHDGQFVVASANELGSQALDLESIPRCSAEELRHPKCRLVTPRKDVEMRWVRGWSMFESRMVHVPAALVYLHVPLTPAERIATPITTGCAAYTSYDGALLRGILEVVERDALSVVWLQRLPLPRIAIDVVPSDLAPEWDLYQRASPDLEYLFFDATTDLGVFTVYALQIARGDPRVRTLVSCATDVNPARAIAKAIRDLAHLRTAFRHEHSIPSDWDDFVDLLDGATFMARASQAPAFEFLTRTPHVRSLSSLLPTEDHASTEDTLAAILRRLRRDGFDVYAIDLSTDEAIRCGIRVVRAIIPGLQPLSLSYRARYLGHGRVFDAPRRMGYPVAPEPDINPFPQPFA